MATPVRIKRYSSAVQAKQMKFDTVDEGRPSVFRATMSTNRFTDIIKCIRFDDTATLESRQAPVTGIFQRHLDDVSGTTS